MHPSISAPRPGFTLRFVSSNEIAAIVQPTIVLFSAVRNDPFFSNTAWSLS
jgi:hypothetical protein